MLQRIKERIVKIRDDAVRMDSFLISAAAINYKTFSAYKNMCNGETDVVICAPGPSLQEYKPISGCINIALNRAFMYDKVAFDFVFAQDYDGIKMVSEELIKYKGNNCVKLLGRSDGRAKEIPESYAIKCNAKRFVTDSVLFHDGYKSRFVSDIEYRPIGGMPNVGMSVLQFAAYLNPRKIYIVGCDMSGTHFVSGNQTESEKVAEKKEMDRTWNSKNREKLINKWKEIRDAITVFYPDIEIITVNPIGLKGIFKDYYQK